LLVKRALEGLKGVRKAEVTFEPPEAIVTYEKGAVTIERMQQAVARYGFTATLKTPSAR
jgi:copper chaperone CopZ